MTKPMTQIVKRLRLRCSYRLRGSWRGPKRDEPRLGTPAWLTPLDATVRHNEPRNLWTINEKLREPR